MPRISCHHFVQKNEPWLNYPDIFTHFTRHGFVTEVGAAKDYIGGTEIHEFANCPEKLSLTPGYSKDSENANLGLERPDEIVSISSW
jgi:hypothetical protein